MKGGGAIRLRYIHVSFLLQEQPQAFCIAIHYCIRNIAATCRHGGNER